MKKVKISLVAFGLLVGGAGAFAGSLKTLDLPPCAPLTHTRAELDIQCPPPPEVECCKFYVITVLTDTHEVFGAGSIVFGARP